MDEKQKDIPTILSDRYRNALQAFARCKTSYISQQEDLNKVREINSRLEVELKEALELEESHLTNLQISKEMNGNLQETVSELVNLRMEVQKLKDELTVKSSTIAAAEKEKESLLQKHDENLMELRNAQEMQIEEMTAAHERKIQQLQNDSDTQIAQFTCVIEELRAKIQEMEAEHRDKVNILVLDYEEKIQKSAAQMSQIQEQLARQAQRADANIDAYRKKLEELEEKLKQSQFKQYLAQISHSQYENHVERPYSVERDLPDRSIGMDTMVESRRNLQTPISNNKGPKQSTLQVMYYGNQTPNVPKNDKKGLFNISKKRKLFSEKDLSDF